MCSTGRLSAVRFAQTNPTMGGLSAHGSGAPHQPLQNGFRERKEYHNFVLILYTESQILYTIPSCAISNSNLERLVTCIPPPKMQFQHKKLDHNFVLILYNFVHQVPNFVHHSLLRYRQLKFGGAGDMHPPKCSFNIKSWIIILYSFCKILYTQSKILYTIPSCAIGNSNLGAGDMQPPP